MRSIAAPRLRRGFIVMTLWVALFSPLPEIGKTADTGGYASVNGPCHLRFPEDHGPHPGYKTEWWYYTGNLADAAGRPFGFQFTFFRHQIAPTSDRRSWPDPPSAWRTDAVILMHLAVSDIAEDRFLHHRDMGRAAAGMAGAGLDATMSGDTARIFLKNSAIRIGPREHRLDAETRDIVLSFTFSPEKPPVFHGDNGYSRKGSSPERASCYYSFTRLTGGGTLRIQDRTFTVTGDAWMDHEFSTAPLEPGVVGWDWFSLQLSNGAEIMIYLLRKEDGALHPVSQGTFVDADGKATPLRRSDFQITVTDHWKSPGTGARYPSGWRLRLESPAMDLAVTPRIRDQEMAGSNADAIVYWEGSVSVEGTRDAGAAKKPITGLGYVELTGYAEALTVLRE